MNCFHYLYEAIATRGHNLLCLSEHTGPIIAHVCDVLILYKPLTWLSIKTASFLAFKKNITFSVYLMEPPWWLRDKESACHCRRHGWERSPGWGRSPGKEMATHSSIFTWEIPWTEVVWGLHSKGSPRVGHDLVTEQQPQADLEVGSGET